MEISQSFKKRVLIPTIILFLIFLTTSFSSGCISRATQCPVVVSQTDGLIINRFKPSYDLIPVGDKVRLQLEVQNVGTAFATNINATLWSHPGFAVLDFDEAKDGKVPSNTPPGTIDKTKTTMASPDLSICSAGDSQIIEWELQAGCDPRESVIAAAIDYDYTSEGFAKILIVSQDEASKTGGKFREKGENVPSAGPLQIIIEPLQTEPVIVSETSPNFDVRVKFKNAGSGLVGSGGGGYVTKVTLTIEGPCKFTNSNEFFVNTETVEWRPPTPQEEANGISGTQVVLKAGKQEALKVANIVVTTDFSTFVKDFCTITATSDYHYRIVESVEGKVGITGSHSQVQECRANPCGNGVCEADLGETIASCPFDCRPRIRGEGEEGEVGR